MRCALIQNVPLRKTGAKERRKRRRRKLKMTKISKHRKRAEAFKKKREEMSEDLSAFRKVPLTQFLPKGKKVVIYGRGVEVLKPVMSYIVGRNTKLRGQEFKKGELIAVKKYARHNLERLKKRFRIARELVEAGAPIAKPRLFYTKGNRVVWMENAFGDMSVYLALREAKSKAERERIRKAYEEAKLKIEKILKEKNYEPAIGFFEMNALYDKKTGKVRFTDFDIEKKRKPSK